MNYSIDTSSAYTTTSCTSGYIYNIPLKDPCFNLRLVCLTHCSVCKTVFRMSPLSFGEQSRLCGSCWKKFTCNYITSSASITYVTTLNSTTATI